MNNIQKNLFDLDKLSEQGSQVVDALHKNYQ